MPNQPGWETLQPYLTTVVGFPSPRSTCSHRRHLQTCEHTTETRTKLPDIYVQLQLETTCIQHNEKRGSSLNFQRPNADSTTYIYINFSDYP